MVERVNGTIKNATVKATTYQNIDGMKRVICKVTRVYQSNIKYLIVFILIGVKMHGFLPH
jgi:hypothetical protein